MSSEQLTQLLTAFDLSQLVAFLIKGAPFIIGGLGILIVVGIVFTVTHKVSRRVTRS